MKQTEIISQLAFQCATTGFLSVSPPLTYKGQGPFLFAAAVSGGQSYFFGFEIVEAASFLAQPAQRASAYREFGFLELLSQHMDLGIFNDVTPPRTTLHRIVPDEPACRAEVCRLWKTDPAAAAGILLVSAAGIWSTGKDVLQTPVWLS